MECQFARADLCGADLRGADIYGAKLTDAYYDDSTQFDPGVNPALLKMKEYRHQASERCWLLTPDAYLPSKCQETWKKKCKYLAFS